jgi:hypothetical protein
VTISLKKKKEPVRKVLAQIVWRISTLRFEAGVCRLRRANHLTTPFGKFVNHNSVTMQTISFVAKKMG